MEKNKLNQLEERPIWVFRLLHTHPRCILWEFHACLLGFLELSSSKLLKKTPLPTSKRHQLMSVIGNVMELSILRSFFKPYKSLPFSKLSRKVHPIDLIPKSWGQPRCGSLTIDVQRMPLNGVKMETPFQKWFKPPPSGKHSSPEIHFQGNSSSNGSMCHCYAGTTQRHVDTCGDIPKPCQLPSIATSWPGAPS